MELPLGKVWSGRAPVGQSLQVVCRSGMLWVTAEDGVDHILGPGECYRTSKPVLVVAEALEDSEALVASLGPKEGTSIPSLLRFIASRSRLSPRIP